MREFLLTFLEKLDRTILIYGLISSSISKQNLIIGYQEPLCQTECNNYRKQVRNQLFYHYLSYLLKLIFLLVFFRDRLHLKCFLLLPTELSFETGIIQQ